MTRKVVSKHGMAAAIAALALAGCGAQAGTSGASPAAPSVAQVATRIGATGVTTEPSPTLYARHEGSATWPAQGVDLAAFPADPLRNGGESVAKPFGPILADGHHYAVTTG